MRSSLDVWAENLIARELQDVAHPPLDRYRIAGDRILGFFDDIRQKELPGRAPVDPEVEAAVRAWAEDEENVAALLTYEHLRRAHADVFLARIPIVGIRDKAADMEARVAALDALLPEGTVPNTLPDPHLLGARRARR